MAQTMNIQPDAFIDPLGKTLPRSQGSCDTKRARKPSHDHPESPAKAPPTSPRPFPTVLVWSRLALCLLSDGLVWSGVARKAVSGNLKAASTVA